MMTPTSGWRSMLERFVITPSSLSSQLSLTVFMALNAMSQTGVGVYSVLAAYLRIYCQLHWHFDSACSDVLRPVCTPNVYDATTVALYITIDQHQYDILVQCVNKPGARPEWSCMRRAQRCVMVNHLRAYNEASQNLHFTGSNLACLQFREQLLQTSQRSS